MYQKEIIYMGLYKDGNRIGNAGFLKVENRESESQLNLNLRNLPVNVSGRFPIRLHDGAEWKEVNGISIQEGGGNWNDTAEAPVERAQVQITLPGGYFLEGKSKNAAETTPQFKPKEERKPEMEERKRPVEEEKKQKEERTDTRAEEEKKPKEERTDMRAEEEKKPEEERGLKEEKTDTRVEKEKKPKEERTDTWAEEKIRPEETERKNTAHEERKNNGIVTEELQRRVPDRNYVEPARSPETPAAYSLKEDKWEQILDSYEQIHPYGDERVYVRLEPKDFIILQSKYQHLVNNSFLLHGFYNYRYVILGKEQDYYLGVPGVYYEREKMVALMFGFEAFECPGGIARAGEFGYYLRKVEL